MFFMLDESIITSAADPTKAGQSVREVGTNPFIVGSEGEEGNIFYRIIKRNPGVHPRDRALARRVA
jgi:phosphoenolpyruvate carboxykinase (ATP)